MPPNEIFKLLWDWGTQFICTRWIALIIWLMFIIWSINLQKKFSDKAVTFQSEDSPCEKWISLQCQHWKSSVNHILVMVYLTIGLSFLLSIIEHLFESLHISKEVFVGSSAFGTIFLHLQLIGFLVLITFKIRALWDAHGVFKDFKKAGL